MINMTYKDYEEKYLDQMIKIFINSFNTEPWNDKWTPAVVEKRLLQIINTEGYQGLLAFEEDKMVGLLLGVEEYTYQGREFVIKELCVAPAAKGKGTGTSLLQELETRLQSQGFDKITLITLKSSATLGFYKKQNYKETPSLVYMEKSLSATAQEPTIKHYIFSDESKAITYEDDYATVEEAQAFNDLLEKQFGKKFGFVEG